MRIISSLKMTPPHSVCHHECDTCRLTMQIQLGAFDRHRGWTGGCWSAQLISWSFLLQLKRTLAFILFNLTPSFIKVNGGIFWEYLIKKINGDIIKKRHISSSILFSVHRLLGWLQQTPKANTFVNVCFCDNNHPAGAFILLLILLLIIRVASWGQTSPPSNPTSNCPVPKSSFTGGGEGKSQCKRREGKRQTGELCCKNVKSKAIY